MTGRESLSWRPLATDFVLLARKLEKFGFLYHEGVVIVTDPDEI